MCILMVLWPRGVSAGFDGFLKCKISTSEHLTIVNACWRDLHGAAATVLLSSPHRTALQPQRFCHLHTARRCGHSAFAISTPHGAAATARLLSPHRTALQPQLCVNTARRCSHSAFLCQHRKVHEDKCAGAKTAVRAESQGPLRGEAHTAK